MTASPVQTFSAPTMHEALARVRESLGPDAVVLHTRQVGPKGMFGKKGSVVEVTASRGVINAIESTRDVVPPARAKVSPKAASPAAPVSTSSTTSLEDQVRRLQRIVDRLSGLPSGQGDVAKGSNELEQYLISLEFPHSLVRECMEVVSTLPFDDKTPDQREVIDALIAFLASRIRTAPWMEETKETSAWALVGPPGAGKTTTMARLASQSLDFGRPVQLVTMDEYRVGAADEVRRYADIFGIAWATVRTPAELRRTIDRQKRGTLVLIDTPGRAAVELKEIEEMGRFLDRGVSKALVVPTNVRESSMRASLDAFRMLDYERLIFTKLDETPGTGAVAGLAAMSPVPVAYICLGQSIRGDLEPAESLRLARWSLGDAARAAERTVVEPAREF